MQLYSPTKFAELRLRVSGTGRIVWFQQTLLHITCCIGPQLKFMTIRLFEKLIILLTHNLIYISMKVCFYEFLGVCIFGE